MKNIIILFFLLTLTISAKDAPFKRGAAINSSIVLDEAINNDSGMTRHVITLNKYTSTNPYGGVSYLLDQSIISQKTQISFGVNGTIFSNNLSGIKNLLFGAKLQLLEQDNHFCYLAIRFNAFAAGFGNIKIDDNTPVSQILLSATKQWNDKLASTVNLSLNSGYFYDNNKIFDYMTGVNIVYAATQNTSIISELYFDSITKGFNIATGGRILIYSGGTELFLGTILPYNTNNKQFGVSFCLTITYL